MLEEADVFSSDPVKLGDIEGQTAEVYTKCQQSSERFKCLCYQRCMSVWFRYYINNKVVIF